AAGRDDTPRAGAAARDGRIRTVAGLERERHIAVLRSLDERAARVSERLPGMLLVAGEDDRDVHVAEHARCLQRLESVQNYDVPALDVGSTDRARAGIFPHPVRPSGFDHRIEAEHRTHLAHALEIQRAAGDVDDLLQVGDLRFARGGNARPHSLLRAVEARRLENEKDGGEIHYGTALTVSWARRRSSASRSACLRSRSSRTYRRNCASDCARPAACMMSARI